MVRSQQYISDTHIENKLEMNVTNSQINNKKLREDMDLKQILNRVNNLHNEETQPVLSKSMKVKENNRDLIIWAPKI